MVSYIQVGPKLRWYTLLPENAAAINLLLQEDMLMLLSFYTS